MSNVRPHVLLPRLSRRGIRRSTLASFGTVLLLYLRRRALRESNAIHALGVSMLVLLGLVAILYFSRTGARYQLWASLVALLLGISALQSSGQVVLFKKACTRSDPLSRALNGPSGLRVRIGLFILLVLLMLLALGLLDPTR